MSEEKLDSPIRILWLIIGCNQNSLSFIELNANLIVEMIFNLLSVSTVYSCNTFDHHIDNDGKIYHIVWGRNVAIGHKYIFNYGRKSLGDGSWSPIKTVWNVRYTY